jgi:hypothetical protein|nr:MAG TPA_asm: hypothetical protein [Caudoviricetes sp.]
MSRRILKKEEPQVDIASIIDSYGKNKDEEKCLKKYIDKESKQIKEYFSKNNLECFESEKYTATVSNTTKTSLNDDLAIEILKANLKPEELKTVIKTKEYIDEDALEKLSYSGFDMSILERAFIEKVTSTLRIKKNK